MNGLILLAVAIAGSLGFASPALARGNTEVKEIYRETFASGASDDYAATIARFQKYRVAKNGEPFLALHGRRTHRVAVLFHSLTMSPHEQRELARTLYQRGFNVVVPGFEGHTGDNRNMGEVETADWIEDARFAMAIASRLGDEIIVGGFSLGGLVSVNTAIRYPDQVKGLILLGPALWNRLPMTGLSCLGSAIVQGSLVDRVSKMIRGSGMSRFEQNIVQGACPLRGMIQDIQDLAKKELPPFSPHEQDPYKLWEISYGKIKAPVFMAYSTEDEMVDPNHLDHFAGSVAQTSRATTFRRFDAKDRVSHVGLIYLDRNFGDSKQTLRQSLETFLDQNFPPASN